MEPSDINIIEKWLENISPPPTAPSAIQGSPSALDDSLSNTRLSSGRHMSNDRADLVASEDEGPRDPDATPRQPRQGQDGWSASVSHSFASTHHQSLPQSDNSMSVSVDASSATTATSFAAAFTRNAYFLPRAESRSPRTPSPSKRSQRSQRSLQSRQSSSPSKRPRTTPRTTASLANLARPVRFERIAEQRIAEKLPADAIGLYHELVTIAKQVGILPRALNGSEELKGLHAWDFMWQAENDVLGRGGRQNEDYQTAAGDFRRIKRLVDKSNESANMHRSEAAVTGAVRYPALDFFASEFPSVEVEIITSAQIAKAFRPPWRDTAEDDASSVSLESTVSSKSSVTSGGTRGGAASTSAHKMVDLALVLNPDEQLAAVIDGFLRSQDQECATVNQTTYEPLCRRPAPVCIETKTSSGNSETAKLQLGVWIAAYHQRLRSILEQRPGGGEQERIITLPVVQWYDGTWIVSFAVDAGSGIDVLDVDLQVGSTNSIIGAYQLRQAVACLVVWMENQFKPWFMSILTPSSEVG